MEKAWKDIRFALRTFRASPAFVSAAVVSLALGIGVNTAIFTLVNALFLNPLPVERASELVAVYTVDARNRSAFSTLLQSSYPNYLDYRDRNDVFSGLAAYTFPLPVGFSTGGPSERGQVELVTGNYFDVLGVRPAAGRFFGPDDDRARGGAPVIVLAFELWQRRFGGATDLVGRALTINGLPFTVRGIAPDGFHGVNAVFGPDMWAPTSMSDQILPAPLRSWMDERRALAFTLAGRLKPER